MGALVSHVTKTTCCYCGVGCGMLVETEGAGKEIRIKSVQGDPDHPANFGKLCTKGSTLDLTAQAHVYEQLRAKFPEIRQERTMARSRADWPTTFEYVAEKFAKIINEHGKDSVGIYVSGQLLTEDYYIFNKIAKGLIGSNNIDTNSRLCMSSAVAGYKQALGVDAPPCNYEDIDHAEVFFITGSNMAYAHPILFRRVEEAKKKNPKVKLIVVDPRRTDTADTADIFLQILPGTDVALYHGMMHLILWEAWANFEYIQKNTEGFAELKDLVRNYTPKAVAEICGIAEADLLEATRLFALSKSSLSFYCQGLNQSTSGTDKNTALINLHLATGQIGKPGAGPFSLTGQPNAMGGREVGGLSNVLSAHRDMANPSHRKEIADLWGVQDVPELPGLTAIPMFEALRTKNLKAIWIVCTNPAQSLPDQNLVREALENAEFVVVQDAYANTATAQYADVFLPATTWAEKEGTVTNSERRISRVRAALPAYAECKNDWEIALGIAKLLEQKIASRVRVLGTSLFNYKCPEDIWNEHRESTRGRDLDITGLSYQQLEQFGSQQWPYPTGAQEGKKRLYEDGVFCHPNGRARFIAHAYKATAEESNARYPFALMTGRLRDQWHGMSRTGSLARLYSHVPKACVEISNRDAKRLDVTNGDLVYVTSKRGIQILPVELSESVRSSQAFIGMHWGEEFVSGKPGKQISHGVNDLTIPALDPYSEQPEFKHSAVKITKADMAWHLSAFALISQKEALKLQVNLRHFYKEASYATAVLFGRESEAGFVGVSFTLAHTEKIDDEMISKIRMAFGFQELEPQQSILAYQDSRKGTQKIIRLDQDHLKKVVTGVLLTGSQSDVSSQVWLKNYLEHATDVTKFSRRLLMNGKNAPEEIKATGKIICNCFNISESAINESLAEFGPITADEKLQKLQAKLACGTNCGSCLPELKKIIQTHVNQPIH